ARCRPGRRGVLRDGQAGPHTADRAGPAGQITPGASVMSRVGRFARAAPQWVWVSGSDRGRGTWANRGGTPFAEGRWVFQKFSKHEHIAWMGGNHEPGCSGIVQDVPGATG